MYIVQIEFKRIQSFIFAVPKLKEMVGANALLGDIVRGKLVEIALENHATGTDIKDIFCPKDRTHHPLSIDPLHQEDDPASMWAQGILSRDGGHFYCCFAQEENERNFVQQTQALLSENAPDLMYEIYTSTVNAEGKQTNKTLSPMPTSSAIPQLPIFQTCQHSHKNLASELIEYSTKKGNRKVKESIYVSSATKCKIETYNAVVKSKQDNTHQAPKELATLLTNTFSFIDDLSLSYPNDLNELVGEEGDYLAVIAADGNAMGYRVNACKPTNTTGFFEEQCHYEHFFHRSRVALRSATHKAINTVITKHVYKQKDNHIPFQILMLGGDDLLLICRAKYALQLVDNIANELKQEALLLADGKPLTLGFGVVIAKPSLPFHRLHQTAETLISSAKCKWRGLDHATQAQHSVVDWTVVSESWIDDPIKARRQQHLHKYKVDDQQITLVTSQKPYLCQATDRHVEYSLNQLLAASERLWEKHQTTSEDISSVEVARNQLRRFIQELPYGHQHALHAWQKIPSKTRISLVEELTAKGNSHSDTSQWPWHTHTAQKGQTVFTTVLADLIELTEINSLQRSTQTKATNAKEGVTK